MRPRRRRCVPRCVEIPREELVPDCLGEVGLRVVEERRHVVLGGLRGGPLIVDEPRFFVAHHDVPRLEIPIQEEVTRRLEQELGENVEIALQPRFVERNLGELEEVVFEVVQVPEDRLLIEGGPGWATS